ncbi:MAG: GFA family protein [Rhizobiaceae bacterium]
MLLHGSCHCGAVSFNLESPHPYPFNLCYCEICRKTAGGGGYAINLGGNSNTLEIKGEEHIKTYRARFKTIGSEKVSESPAERKFCSECGSALWVWDPRWPELVHPHASAIDTDLPTVPEKTHLMLASKASWVEPCLGKTDKSFDEYPEESIADWHERNGVTK